MDLRTIMNSEAGGASNPPAKSSSPPSEPSHPPHAHKPMPYPSEYVARPAQPHAHHVSPDRSSPYGPTQSPYQQFNAPPPLNTTVQSNRSQSPQYAPAPYAPGARDAFGAPPPYNAPQPAAPLASPYTPHPMSAGPQHPEQQSYFAQQRSHSLQTVMTNPRAPSESFRPRDSPPSATPQSLPTQHFSPSAHRSVPSTPLGPPPTFSSRRSPSSARPPSSGHDSPRNPLSSPRPAHDPLTRDSPQTQSPVTRKHLSPLSSRPSDPAPQITSAGLKQEPVESVGLKSASRTNNVAIAPETREAPPIAGPGPHVASVAPGMQVDSSPSALGARAPAMKMDIDHEPTARASVDGQPPKPKRRRYNEPPIYARRSVRTKGKCPMIPNQQPPIPKHARRAHQDSWTEHRRSSSVAGPTAHSPSMARASIAPPTNTNGPSMQPAPAVSKEVGSLGPWEPSITGFIPHEEVTKRLCDFLFEHVVLRNDVAAGAAGSAAAGQGAIIEVEAKLGRVLDMDRSERLNLPILTESVINRKNPMLRTSFESNMSIEQHRAMNNFLNDAVKESLPHTNPNRIPLSYAHKKERDTFYEVSAADLPPVIRHNLNPRHKPRVRVTTDQRTGEVLAKIIKCRVADFDVYSPSTHVDWRVSVNLEMEYEGDIHNLTVADAAKGGRGERNKDRMSYRHLAYQVDLTQVARAEPPTKNDFEHELEIEASAAEIRRQGNLAMEGNPNNQYEELVKGFVDNIRVLARAVPP
ncbi:hypothetical protein N7474_008328 [Penicillium riverlandense]|uniref:uncharacterized protein n=1 Tax=Penicillium riverlandense TaxID=1903569 RepID=UPI00254733E1|nr:uncharacterized protein N7474_008328 [Penicillium riverlandense]KAJ5812027.1 hypothetical protein N7474_008328 [Penicillium riverlandense]